jgi:hypothetical protein
VVVHDDDPFVQRLPTVVGGVLATLAVVIGGLWISGRTGLPSPEAVLSLETPGLTRLPEGPVYAVGDSVLTGARTCLQDEDVVVRTKESRSMVQGARLVERAAQRGQFPPLVVVALGTNGPFGFTALDRVMRAAGPDRMVFWVTVELPDTPVYAYEAQVNERLRSMPGRWDNARVIDWNAAVASDDLYPDGIHLSPQGCRTYAGLILAATGKTDS